MVSDSSNRDRNEHRASSDCGWRIADAAAFTLLEVLVGIGLIAVLLSLTVPSLQHLRQRSRELLCLTRASQLQNIVTMYSMDYRGHFPAKFSDRREFLRTATDRTNYGHFPYVAFAEGPIAQYSGLEVGAVSLACPSNQFMRERIEGRWTVDFSISTAAYLESAYLSPELPTDQHSTMVARVATFDDALFPSQKASVYEAQVWHAWPYRYDPNSTQVVNGLFHWGSGGRISIAFMDGHAAHVFRDEIVPSVQRTNETMNSILNTTPYGMRGQDVR
ncbi:MAG: type II secretion system protein [Planctomycetes bacterium]|nr:type II secretion system protein [Planctomycetota bacterium]